MAKWLRCIILDYEEGGRRMKLSLVVPCYNEQENVHDFYSACKNAFANKIDDYEIVFINDGSRDNTWKELSLLREQNSDARLKLINFSRNFGKEAAMYAGLQKANGDYVTIIDADLQQRPELVVQMVEFLDANPDYDEVAAYQSKRIEGKLTSSLKKSFYKLVNKMCEIDFQSGASDFRTFRHEVVDAILSMPEYHRFSKGIFSWVGFNTHYMPYVAEERNAGTTSWSMAKLFSYAFEGIIAFSVFPLKIATFVGTISSIASIIYMIVVIIQKLAFGINVPGYATLVVLLLLIGGIQLITIGIIGSYIARIYIQGKNRPIYIAKDYISYEKEE